MRKNSPDKRAPVQVGIADKSPLIRTALRLLFKEDDRFELSCICADGEELVDALGQVRLDVAVTGWIIPPSDGRFILDQLQTNRDAPRIVVYTGAHAPKVPAQVMAHGGAAFVSKTEEPEFLLDTIASVAQGRMVFPFLDVRKINQNTLHSLTKRELEVLSSLAAGHTNKQIASAQGVSPNTVKFHIKNLFEKLGVRNRGQAIARYLDP